MNHYLYVKDRTYLNQSLCAYGILLQPYESIIVKTSTKLEVPYIWISEGVLFPPDEHKTIKTAVNIKVFRKGELVLQKITDLEVEMEVLHSNSFDLFEDKNTIDSIINEWDTDDKIYLQNTEHIPNIEKTKCVAGLASGSLLAELASQAEADTVVFFDYKSKALDFQKELINSSDRKKTFEKYLKYLTMGNRPANIDDVNTLDFIKLDNLYNQLKTKKIKYYTIDFRVTKDIVKLIESLPKNTTLWISNVFHYITTLNSYTPNCYNVLEEMCADKNINILPYTKVIYES